MLASFCVVVGPDRAVDAAVEVLGRDAVAAAPPRLQLPALSGATQTALRQHEGMLEDLQRAVEERCQVSEVKFEDLERVDRRSVLTLVVLALVTYFLLPQLADLPDSIDRIRDADWSWLPVILLMSAFTYVAATASLAGAIPDPLPAGPTFVTQVGSSFASKLAPAGLGGMALNVRYLQKRGVDEAVAVSGVGLYSVAGFLGHITLIGIFVVWAGRDAFGAFELPDPKWLLIGLAAVVVLAALAMAVPGTRHLVTGKLFPILRRAVGGVGAVLRRPGKLVLLLGGSVAVTLSYLACTYFCIEAFGGGLPLATVGAVYLTGSAVGTAAPTPGGLGGVVAALIAGFVVRRARQLRGAPGGLPVPARDLLAAGAARLAVLHLAAAQGVRLIAVGLSARGGRRAAASSLRRPWRARSRGSTPGPGQSRAPGVLWG